MERERVGVERELGWRESLGGERVGMREIGDRNLDLGWKKI